MHSLVYQRATQSSRKPLLLHLGEGSSVPLLNPSVRKVIGFGLVWFPAKLCAHRSANSRVNKGYWVWVGLGFFLPLICFIAGVVKTFHSFS